MVKQHTKAMDEIKRELQQERLTNHKRITPRPISVQEFTPVFFQFFSNQYLILSSIFLDRFIIKIYETRLFKYC